MGFLAGLSRLLSVKLQGGPLVAPSALAVNVFQGENRRAGSQQPAAQREHHHHGHSGPRSQSAWRAAQHQSLNSRTASDHNLRPILLFLSILLSPQFFLLLFPVPPAACPDPQPILAAPVHQQFMQLCIFDFILPFPITFLAPAPPAISTLFSAWTADC